MKALQFIPSYQLTLAVAVIILVSHPSFPSLLGRRNFLYFQGLTSLPTAACSEGWRLPFYIRTPYSRQVPLHWLGFDRKPRGDAVRHRSGIHSECNGARPQRRLGRRTCRCYRSIRGCPAMLCITLDQRRSKAPPLRAGGCWSSLSLYHSADFLLLRLRPEFRF